MEKMISSFCRKLLLAIIFFVIVGNLSGCHGEYYFSNEGVYYSEDPYMELNCPAYSGEMTVDGVTYRLGLSFSNNGTEIYIANRDLYDQMPTGDSGDPIIDMEAALLWQADTEIKNGKLYLTVTRDNISDYEGKTVVLEFKPNEG